MAICGRRAAEHLLVPPQRYSMDEAPAFLDQNMESFIYRLDMSFVPLLGRRNLRQFRLFSQHQQHFLENTAMGSTVSGSMVDYCGCVLDV